MLKLCCSFITLKGAEKQGSCDMVSEGGMNTWLRVLSLTSRAINAVSLPLCDVTMSQNFVGNKKLCEKCRKAIKERWRFVFCFFTLGKFSDKKGQKYKRLIKMLPSKFFYKIGMKISVI